MSVTRLIDRTSVAVGDEIELTEWLADWVATLQAGDYGKFRSIAVVLESTDGQVGIISQSVGLMDCARLAGLLTIAAHRRMDGGARIEDLQKTDES